MALRAGTLLGPYEIADQIGAESMGGVYRASDAPLDRTLAIEVPPEHLAGDPQRRERLEREALAVGDWRRHGRRLRSIMSVALIEVWFDREHIV